MNITYDRAILGAAAVGVLSGAIGHVSALSIAQGIAHIVTNLLQLMSVPIIFFSISSTIVNMQGFDTMRRLGANILKYTLLTTIISAAIGLLLFLLIKPTATGLVSASSGGAVAAHGYLAFILNIIPANMLQALSSNSNVVSVVFLAVLTGVSVISIEKIHRSLLQSFFAACFETILTMTGYVMYAMPIGVWAFVTVFVHKMVYEQASLHSIAWYVVCIVAANGVQAFVVLPAFLWLHAISPVRLARAMVPALTTAFFSKSSNATLPLTVSCAVDKAGISQQTAHVSFPLCSVINMNACAAFMVVTVMFVGSHYGMTFSWLDCVLWIGIATVAAVGNAGVPMGCYFLTNAFLLNLGLPLELLWVILPFYTVLDMGETALNVWSDCCVTAVVDKHIGSAKT